MREIVPLERGKYYHLFNRGINGENIFREERNYIFFLEKWKTYLSPVFETFAYCLLKNHFHFLIRIKEEEIKIQNKEGIEYIADPSRQLSHMLNSYAQAFNKTHHRTGSLFESPIKRKLVDDETYLLKLVSYNHFNPQKHQFENDFRIYPHSSYHRIISGENSFLNSKEVIEWFGDISNFIFFHDSYEEEKEFLYGIE